MLPTIKLPEGALQIESKLSKTDIIALVVDSIEEELSNNLSELYTARGQAEKKLVEDTQSYFRNNIIKDCESIYNTFKKISKHFKKDFSVDSKDLVSIRVSADVCDEPYLCIRLSADMGITDIYETFTVEMKNLNKTHQKLFQNYIDAHKYYIEAKRQLDTFNRGKTTAKNNVVKAILASSTEGQNILDSVENLKQLALLQLT